MGLGPWAGGMCRQCEADRRCWAHFPLQPDHLATHKWVNMSHCTYYTGTLNSCSTLSSNYRVVGGQLAPGRRTHRQHQDGNCEYFWAHCVVRRLEMIAIMKLRQDV